MKVVAAVGGVVVIGGLIVLAVAGIAGATAILVTVGALLAMIVLGGQMGGRHTPNVRPVASGSQAPAPGAAVGPGEDAPETGAVTEPTGSKASTEPTGSKASTEPTGSKASTEPTTDG